MWQSVKKNLQLLAWMLAIDWVREYTKLAFLTSHIVVPKMEKKKWLEIPAKNSPSAVWKFVIWFLYSSCALNEKNFHMIQAELTTYCIWSFKVSLYVYVCKLCWIYLDIYWHLDIKAVK